MQEKHAQRVHEITLPQLQRIIPNRLAVRPLHTVFGASVHKPPPRDRIVRTRLVVVDGVDEGQLIAFASLVVATNVRGDCYEGVGAHVHGDDVRLGVGVAVEGAEEPGPSTGTDAGGAVKVVDPTTDGFFVRGDD